MYLSGLEHMTYNLIEYLLIDNLISLALLLIHLLCGIFPYDNQYSKFLNDLL